MSNPAAIPLQRRLEESIRTWLNTPVDPSIDPEGHLEKARQVLAPLEKKTRDEDLIITPENDKAKNPRLIIAASDEGRAYAYAPIRKLGTRLVIRANAKVAAGHADPFLAYVAALELLLDTFSSITYGDGCTALMRAWSSRQWNIAVMLAVRRGANVRSAAGDKRAEAMIADVRAVGLEHTA